MTGLDTNVLLRFFAQDDAAQILAADRIIGSLTSEEPGWVSITTILEIAWVLGSSKQAGRIGVSAVLEKLLSLDSVIVEQAEMVASAVRQFRSTRADFADCLIAASARAAGCSRMLTFDRIAARDAGMELIG